MEGWQIDIVKVLVTATVSAIGGIWVHWAWTRKKQLEADLREQQRQAEHEEFKEKRRLTGAGEIESLERDGRYVTLLAELRRLDIPPDKYAEFRDLLAGKKSRSIRMVGRIETRKVDVFQAAKDRLTQQKEGKLLDGEKLLTLAPFDDRLTSDQRLLIGDHLMSLLKEKGPNNSPVGYDYYGNKVEWSPGDQDEIGEGETFQRTILLRGEEDIHSVFDELSQKAVKKTKNFEDKHGRDALKSDDFQLGIVNGKLSAIRWVLGEEWDARQ